MLAMNASHPAMHKILKPADISRPRLTRTFRPPMLRKACLFHASPGSRVVVAA